MNKANSMISLELESLEDRVDILFKELELAVKWQRPSILLAVYRSRYVYADAVASLENHLIDLGQKVVCFQMKNSQNPDLVSLMSAVAAGENIVFFVDGLQSKLRPDGYNVYRSLNLSRDYFVKNCIRVVFWLTENEVTSLAHFAPDYWAFRHRVVEFVESPQPEQILLRALESTWQVAGEYTDTLEDTDEKIKLRNAMLTELPEAPESTGIRANLLLTLGILHWRKGNLEKALEFLQASLAIMATIDESWMKAACYNAIALVQTDLGAIDEAIAAYRQAIRLSPDQIFPWNNLGNLYQKLDRHAEALNAFQKAIEHNERDGIAWNGMGNAYFKLGEISEAIKAYKTAIDLLPNFANPWNGLGNVHLFRMESEEAIAAFEKATTLNQNFVAPWISLGKLFAASDRSQDALRVYWNALRVDQKNAHIWNALGNVYFQSGGFEEAIQAYNKAIDLDRDFESSYTNLAVAYARIGQHGKAITCYQKSVELLTNATGMEARLPGRVVKPEPPEVVIEGELQPVRVNDDGVIIETSIGVEEISPAVELEMLNREAVIEAQPLPLAEPAIANEVESAMLETANNDPGPSDQGAFASQAEVQRLEALEHPEPFMVNTYIDVPANVDLNNVDVPLPSAEGAAVDDLIESVESIEATADLMDAPDKTSEASESESDLASIIAESHPGEVAEADLPSPEIAKDEAPIETSLATLEVEVVSGNAAVETSVVESAELEETAVVAEAKANALAPEARDAQFFNELGNFYFNVGAFDDAALAYKKAIEFDPWFGWAYSNLALAYSLQKKMSEAVSIYGQIAELVKREDGEKLCWIGSGKAVQFPQDDNETHVVKQTSDAMYYSATTSFENIREISIEAIYPNPRQPRFDINVDELVESVRLHGVIQPLIVTPNGTPGMFILIAGERRLEAARQVGLKKVPVVVREVNERERLELALVENAQREDLKPIELATAYKQLADEFGLSHDEIAARVGKSRAAITNTIRLLKLSEKVKFALMDQRISEGHARAMLSLSTVQAQNAVLQYILDNSLSVRRTEELVRNTVSARPGGMKTPEQPVDQEADVSASENVEPQKIPVRREFPAERSPLFRRARSILQNGR